eukprot:4448587-Amphidinium_carterae.1
MSKPQEHIRALTVEAQASIHSNARCVSASPPKRCSQLTSMHFFPSLEERRNEGCSLLYLQPTRLSRLNAFAWMALDHQVGALADFASLHNSARRSHLDDRSLNFLAWLLDLHCLSYVVGSSLGDAMQHVTCIG